MESGDDQDVPDAQGRKKRYHRHTPRQIQELEAMFKVCPHPDEKQRMQLSRDLALEPRQIKFWFQNRRTQIKAQLERADNSSLRSENDKIRCENIAMREALRNAICPSCGPLAGEDSYDEQKMRMENAWLHEQLDRISSITSKYLGRQITQLPLVHPVSISSLDLSVGAYSDNPGMSPSLDLDLLCGSSLSAPWPSCPFPTGVSELEKPLMIEMAASAMDEVIRLAQTGEPLWFKSSCDGRDVLNLEAYERMFPRQGQQLKFSDTHIEASRDSDAVLISAVELANMFMDASKWMELFPTILSKARTIEVLMGEMTGNRNGSLILMHQELQVLSPVVPTRSFCILRYCQQIEQNLWIIADVSVDSPRDHLLGPMLQSRKLPSGCLIQDLSNGYSKVTWIEHMEIKEPAPVHLLFRDLVYSGVAFGAQRWLAALQRMCERNACLLVAEVSPRDLGGVDSKRGMMKLAQRMVNNFSASINSSNAYRGTNLSGMDDSGVRINLHKATGPGQPNGVILSAATTIWLPISSERVFNFLIDEHARSQWDVLSTGNVVREVSHITNAARPGTGNCVSFLRGLNSSQNNMLILQESFANESESVVVYSPVDLPAINIIMSGEDTASIPLLPSGFTIMPNRQNHYFCDGAGDHGASTSTNPMGGGGSSLVTVAFQILMSSLPTAKLNFESITTINNLISTTVQQIRAALHCP